MNYISKQQINKDLKIDKLYYQGNKTLLSKPIISIVGSRRPSKYTQIQTLKLASTLANAGYFIASGAALGVDAIAHNGAYPHTIAVMANSLDITYPKTNQKLINNISQNALTLSEYEPTFRATPYSFVRRNRIVVYLGEILIVTQADINSGSMRSVEYAIKMGKKIYVLPHQIGESKGTQHLLATNKAKCIYDIDDFIHELNPLHNLMTPNKPDEILEFCRDGVFLCDALERFGDTIYEYELEGKLKNDGINVYVC